MQSVKPLTPGGCFHIFGRGVNRDNIFFEDRNYEYFMGLYLKYIAPIADTYAYCLLRNHFHLLVRINRKRASKSFNNFLTAYAKAVNKTYRRTGPLFQHHFGRIPVYSNRYYTALIRYIHQNPFRHGLVDDFRDWPFSSYHELTSKAYTHLARPTVLEWFGGASGLRKNHGSFDTGAEFDPLIGNDLD
jgi:putative transposase